ncbi:LOW QUALITY PROTEIN: uncharacterized protein ACMZJ9_008656 [Mantella aurantiaca]
MGGQKKNSRRKQRRGGHDDLLPQDRMKVKMQNKAKKKTAQKYSVHQLLEKAEEYLDNFNYEMARLFCQRALDMEPDNLETLGMMGNVCMELGDADKAKQISFCAELSPDKGHAKYMCLGQIHCKEEAVQYFQKGLQIMIRTYQSQPQASGAASWQEEEIEVTAMDVSAAFCSVAEIYLTDLCMEEGAGDKCKEAIEKALEYNPISPEALQLMASYLFSMEQTQEGKEYLLKSLASWLPSMQKKGEQESEEEARQPEISEAAFPPYECRITTAKLLIEAEELELAAEILEGLLEEDDEVIQVWYLLGWVCYLQAKEPEEEEAFKDSARTYLRKAKKLYVKLQCDDSPLMEHVDQLLSQLGGEDAQQDSETEDVPVDNIGDDFVQSSDDEAMES